MRNMPYCSSETGLKRLMAKSTYFLIIVAVIGDDTYGRAEVY